MKTVRIILGTLLRMFVAEPKGMMFIILMLGIYLYVLHRT